MDEALPRELELAYEKAGRHYERTVKSQGWGSTTGALRITEEYLPRVSASIREALGEDRSRELVALIRDLDPDLIALCSLTHSLNSVAMGETLRDTALRLGSALAGECWAAGLTRDQPGLAVRIARAAKERHSGLKQRQQAVRSAAKRAGYQTKWWPRDLVVEAGGWCLYALQRALPEVFSLAVRADGQQELTVAEEALERAHRAAGELIHANPVYQPQAAPPAPWSWIDQGGPSDRRVLRKLVRSADKASTSAVRAALKSGQMQPALDALNALQATPWRINRRILGVLQGLRAQNLSIPGMPGERAAPPEHGDWDAMDEGQQRAWKIKAARVAAHNRGLIGDHILFEQDMATAEQLAELERFWTPMNLDWRGRVYGMCHFNFQREDRVRGLFEFADGEEIGTEGLYWLKVHVANNWGGPEKIDKRPFAERAAWVDQNMEQITEAAEAPLASVAWWSKADNPFLFLAACFELVAALTSGPGYVTHVPVSFDGSCSGLQHLCAMTRAPEGALVNLTPQAAPQDVYQTVADITRRRIEGDLENPELSGIAQACLDYGVTRKLVKRNVMTYSYSSKVFGMAEQHREDTMRPLALEVLERKRDAHPFGDDEGRAASKYLAKHVYAAIEQVVNLPAAAMTLLQRTAKALAHEAKPVAWVTPVGLPWINRYHESTTKRVYLWMHDRGVRVQTEVLVATDKDTRTIAKDKAAQAVAPNFVHACDAAHLMLTVNACVAEGINQIATVHDSFGCLASRAGRFRSIIREQFVRMYETHDVLAEVLAQAKCDLTQANWHRLPDAMAYGPLDLKEVLNAEYAFA